MSLLSRDRYIAVLGATGVALFRLQQGRFEPLGRVDFATAGTPAASAAADALERLLGAGLHRRGSLSVVLSSHFVRFGVIPWGEQIATPEELEQYARLCFEEVYGSFAEAWTLRLSPEGAGRPRLAAAIERSLLERLQGMTETAGLRLQSVQPYLMAAFNHFARTLPEEEFLLLVAEPGRSAVLLAREGRWAGVRALASDDSDSALGALLEREIELLALDEGGVPAVHVHVPGRAHCTPDVAGLQPRILDLPQAPAQAGRDALLVMAMAVS